MRLPGAFGRGIESWIGFEAGSGGLFDSVGVCVVEAMTAVFGRGICSLGKVLVELSWSLDPVRYWYTACLIDSLIDTCLLGLTSSR